MPPIPLFYIAAPCGAVSGPHHPGIIRQGLASGELSPETRVALKGTERWRPLGEFTKDLEMPKLPSVMTPPRGGDLSSHRIRPEYQFGGTVLAVATLALSLEVALLFDRRMPVQGFIGLLGMSGCLAGAMTLLDPLRK